MTGGGAVRYVVASTPEALTLLRRLERAGWRVRQGFPPSGPAEPGAVLVGPVRDGRTAALVVRAAAGGAAVVAIADPATEIGRALVAGLRRSGPVHLGAVGGPASRPAGVPPPEDEAAGHGPDPARSAPLAGLVPEQRALLERLANGETIATAAAAEYLSLRTANRRIAQARELLGVRSTREAVRLYLRQRFGREPTLGGTSRTTDRLPRDEWVKDA